MHHTLDTYVRDMTNLPSLVIGGDFNCVVAGVDRLINGVRAPVGDAPNEYHALVHAFDLVDAFRSIHPDQIAFTRIRGTSASRIDRILVSRQVRHAIKSCDIHPDSLIPTDHMPIHLHLVPKSIPRGPSYWKFNAAYAAHDDYRQLIQRLVRRFEGFRHE